MARLCATGLCAFAAAGWVRPALPVTVGPSAMPREAQLDYMLIAVNGEPRIVAAGKELTVLWGDTLQVQRAVLQAANVSPEVVDVIGLKSRVGRAQLGDRGVLFTTGELAVRWAEQRRGDVYAVVASSGKLVHGAVFLRLTPPALAFAEVAINGEKKTLRPGEALQVRKQDQLQVERVVTNLPGNDGVLFNIAPSARSGLFSIQFLRGGKVFAEVPLTVSD